MMNENQFCVPLILRAQPPYLYKEVPLPPPPSPPTKHHSTDWAIGSNVLNDRHNKQSNYITAYLLLSHMTYVSAVIRLLN